MQKLTFLKKTYTDRANSFINNMKFYGIDIIAGLLVLLFIYTALSKLADFHGFERQMFGQKFSKEVAKVIIYTLPTIEFFVSILLIIYRTRLIGFISSTLLMLVFTAYMGLVYFGYYKTVPCACGGVISSMKFGEHFYFNLFFLAIAILGIIMQYKLTKKGGKG